MNEAIRFAAGPKQAKPRAANMPLEVRLMARELGISPAEMEQASGMWDRLNDLHSTDPSAYAELVKESTKQVEKQQQATEGTGENDIGPAAAAAMEKVLPACQKLTPTPGFVIKSAEMRHGGEVAKLMINCCSHEAVQPPLEQSGSENRADAQSTAGLRVPMAVGKPRPCIVASEASGKAVDVVFNPCVLERAAVDRDFKNDVSALAVRWVAADTSLELGSWKHINSTYKGGTGLDKKQPVPFSVTAIDQPSERPRKDDGQRTTGIAATPESLLQRMRAAQKIQDTSNDDDTIELPGNTDTKPLIEEVGEDVVELSGEGSYDISENDQLPKRAKMAVKKGFLSNTKSKPLYPPSGSDQGQAEGVYSRFMGKCKVVDTSTMSKEDQMAAMRAHAGPPKTPSKSTPKPRMPKADPQFEKLAAEADPEYGAAVEQNDKHYCDPEVEETLGQLEMLASAVYRNDPTFTTKPDLANRETNIETPERVPERQPALGFKPGFLDQPETTTTEANSKYELLDLGSDKSGRPRIKLVVKLPAVASFDDVVLEVAARAVKLRHPPTDFKLKVPLPQGFFADPDNTKAKFSKQSSQLSVILVSCTS